MGLKLKKVLKKVKKFTDPTKHLKNVKRAVSGDTGKKVVRTIRKYEGRVLSYAAPVVGAAFGGVLGAAGGAALGTLARQYGEGQGARAKGKKGAAVKKAERRGRKAGLIIGGIVTGGAAIGAVAGVGGLTSGFALGGSSAAAAGGGAAAAAPVAAAAGGSSTGLLGGIGAALTTVGTVATKLLGGKAPSGGVVTEQYGGTEGGDGAFSSGDGFLSGSGLDPATEHGRGSLMLLAAAAVLIVFLVR